MLKRKLLPLVVKRGGVREGSGGGVGESMDGEAAGVIGSAGLEAGAGAESDSAESDSAELNSAALELGEAGAVGTKGMPPAQQIAMEKLASGETIVDAALAAGVTRMTLHRWLKQDARFAAAYNTWQQEALATARGRLLALTAAAVTTVANSVKAGDTRTALSVLKAMGAMDRPTPGPTEAADVRHEQKVERAKAFQRQFNDELEWGVEISK